MTYMSPRPLSKTRRPLPRVLAATLAAATAASFASPPPAALSDIVSQDVQWSRSQMRDRGYTLISSSAHGGRQVAYWWNGSSLTCVKLVERGARVDELATAPSTDCNQYHAQAAKNDNAAKVAIGAAAIAGLAILAHKSHERDDKHSQDDRSVAEFERGYRDGMHHNAYHNHKNSAAYADGYNAGQQRRDEETRYRSREGRHSGYHPYVSLNDLVGARASSADDQFRARGFRDTGGYKQGGASYVSWYNGDTHQCVQAVTRDGRIAHIEDLYEGNCR